MGLAKAYLELVEAKGPNPPTTSGSSKRIDFQFNPQEIKLTRSAHWQPKRPNVRGGPSPHEYKGPRPTTLTLEMFLDKTDEDNGDVSDQVETLLEACAPTPKSLGTGTPLPAFAIFGWDKVYFRGFIEKVDATYMMFHENGVPVRAKCTITLTETPPGAKKQNPTSGSEGAQAIVQLVDGDSLAAIAFREYGDASMWRTIAEANSIDDPLRIAPGIRLLVPSASEVTG